jgi:hypothetical protein
MAIVLNGTTGITAPDIDVTAQASDITTTGDITAVDATLSGGIYLGGTGSANYLDDYEEGTWTPQLEGDTTAGDYSADSGTTGYYTKVGNLVTVTCRTNNITTNTAGSGTMIINGLPFTVSSSSAGGFGAVVLEYVDISSGSNHVAAEAQAGTTKVRFWETRDNSTNNLIDISSKNSNSADIWFTVSYKTDS